MLPDKKYLLKLVKTRMPFGKYKGRLLIDLPEAYQDFLDVGPACFYFQKAKVCDIFVS